MRPQCTAKSKQTGERCKQGAEPGRKTCRYHGGKSPRGLAHPSATSGLTSRDLSTRLAARAQAGLDDPLLMDLRDAVAWQKGVEAELRSEIGAGGSVAAIREVKAAWAAWQRARPAKEPAARIRLVSAIDALGAVLDSYQKIEEIGRQMDRRARLVKTATESSLDELMTRQFALEVGYVQRAIANAVEKFFKDPKQGRAFMGEVQRALAALMHRGE